MQAFSTPMMKQYHSIKQQYNDCLLLYRMGDFYELFLDDALIGSKVLGITLTSRAKGKDGRIPMAGVPYHAVDSYLSKLVKAGYKVAICEQLSEPNSRGIIDRDVIRIVTPGTLLDEKALEQKTNNFIVCLAYDSQSLAFSIADLSTGLFKTMQVSYTDIYQTIQDEFAKLQPTECLLPTHLYEQTDLIKMLRMQRSLNIYRLSEWETIRKRADTILKDHFKVSSLAGYGVESLLLAKQTSAALLHYLKETQKGSVDHIRTISLLASQDHVLMDRSTMINLELFSTIREHDTKGSLLSAIDQTITPMGGRLLKQWLTHPLTQEALIQERHDAIDELMSHSSVRQAINAVLPSISDIERMISRLSVGIGNARDLVNLRYSLEAVVKLQSTVQSTTSHLFRTLSEDCASQLQEVITIISSTIVDEPSITLKDGGLIKSGVHPRLDLLKDMCAGGTEWLTQLEKQERDRTGIGSLKVRFNRVFGFYIEVSRANAHLVPDTYIRKQTLVNGERYITPELKLHETQILTAEEESNALEYKLYTETLAKVLTFTDSIQQASTLVATVDCICSFTASALAYGYTRPKILYSGEIAIQDGRHPVVEQLLDSEPFVPNSVLLDPVKQQLLIITGPNMAGKSVFIRQVALIVLLAHIGSYVPAKRAHISLVDRIFVRSGASDVITSGLSTFMVEMVETAYILHHATKNSLIIMDEIGRGTSTYDGISIAWAVAEYLVTHQQSPAKTLFATHYHELQALEEKHPTRIKNFHMAVVEEASGPVFLHTLLPGGASSSFGVVVAQLAGIPKEVIAQAESMLHQLEDRHISDAPIQTSPLSSSEKVVVKRIHDLDLSSTTPLQALNILSTMQSTLNS